MSVSAKGFLGLVHSCHLALGKAEAGDYQLRANQGNTERCPLKLKCKRG